jgi:hypothetical protein
MIIAAVPPAIVQIAARVRSQEQGVVLYHLRRAFDVHAGGMARHEELELAVVSRDLNTVKVRVLRSVVDGKPSDDAHIKQIEAQYEHPNAGDVIHRPFDPRYLSEYTYQVVDARKFRFSSLVHDTAHGDGTFSVDDTGNVISYRIAPSVLPKYTTSGTISFERSQVLPGIWQLTSELHEYHGRYAVFSGRATATITYDSYARYSDVSSAVLALQKS